MRFEQIHRWNLTPRAAIALQQRLRERVARIPTHRLPANPLAAGTDVSCDPHSDRIVAIVVLMALPGCDVVETQTVVAKAKFPYVPGLLSFRELPVLLRCFRKLRHTPDVVMADGHGLAHPRRFGIASHLGLILDLPALGCAKSILCGKHAPLGIERGATAALSDRGETIGCALRTRRGVRPVYVSVGHKLNLAAAVDLVLRCAPRFRLPEPTRQAHIRSNALRRSGV